MLNKYLRNCVFYIVGRMLMRKNQRNVSVQDLDPKAEDVKTKGEEGNDLRGKSVDPLEIDQRTDVVDPTVGLKTIIVDWEVNQEGKVTGQEVALKIEVGRLRFNPKIEIVGQDQGIASHRQTG